MTPEIIMIRGGAVQSNMRIASSMLNPPIGIAYLSSFLIGNTNYSIQVIDAFGEAIEQITEFDDFKVIGLTNEEVLKRIPKGVPIIGFSCMFSNEWIYLKELIRKTKQQEPQAVIILGGEHASALADYIFNQVPEIDYIVRGEGEEAFLKLVQFVLEGVGEKEEVPNLVFQQEGRIIKNEVKRIRDINAIPSPAWGLIPIENYLKHGIASVRKEGERIMPIIATRGCPYNCKFCSNEDMWGRLYKTREPKQVVDEIIFYKNEYRITSFEINDLTFIVNKKWFMLFSKELRKADLNLRWEIMNTRSENIDEDVIDGLLETGCFNLHIAPDSGSELQIKKIRKRVDLKHIVECVQIMKRKRMKHKVNLVIGFPDERHSDIWKTIVFGIKLAWHGANVVAVYRFVPYPGSPYFKELQEEGVLPALGSDFDLFLITNLYNDFSEVKSYCKNVSSPFLKSYQIIGLILPVIVFLLSHPTSLINIVRSVRDNKAETILEDFLIRMWLRVKKTVPFS